jgi:hypothetical protein
MRLKKAGSSPGLALGARFGMTNLWRDRFGISNEIELSGGWTWLDEF